MLKSEVKQLKQHRKIEEEDIKHLMKIREEALNIEKSKFEIECERKKNEAIALVKDEYRDKLENVLTGQIEDGKELYGQILERLPNVNVKLGGKA